MAPGHQSYKCWLRVSHNGRHIGFFLPRIWDQEPRIRRWAVGVDTEGRQAEPAHHCQPRLRPLRTVEVSYKQSFYDTFPDQPWLLG